MSKRLLTFFTALLLAVPTIVSGQELTPDEPVFFLTEEQINAEFTIPSTASRTISNLAVDVQEDGVHLSFQMTVPLSDTNTNCAILLLHGDFASWFVGDAYDNEMGITRYEQRQINSAVLRAWRNYVRSFATRSGGEVISDFVVLGDDGISFFGH